ncbi:hypothetical protein BGZ63DRAFT_427584 [Mariannaea sp. PMI_226]|nr:hypothetical protein BGZ63DRAFT_427584 [Mariannaea sp. PMI_226]
MASNSLTNTTLLATGVTAIIITSLVAGTRLVLSILQHRRFQWDDGWLIAAYIFFLVVSSMYMAVGPVIFKFQDLAAGKLQPYPTIADDSLYLQKTFFVTTSGLWICLWCVKFSLLALYKKLLNNLPFYQKIWWGVIAFCVVVLAGAITSSMLSCSSLHAWFTAGACSTERDVKASKISLWYSFAVDIITDVIVMMLPLKLIKDLQMPLSKKISIGSLFCLGLVCIAVSVVRVTQLGQAQHDEQPNAAWLALWGIIESAIAVIIGCGPGFYRKAQTMTSSQKRYYGSQGSRAARSNGFTGNTNNNSRRGDVELSSFAGNTVHVTQGTDSQEELVSLERNGNIMITRSVQVSHNKDS